MVKKIVYHKHARQSLEKGMNILSKVIAITLGPQGKNIVFKGNDFSVPQIVNDGVTIAKEIELINRLENIGANLLKQVALKTDDIVGDGTTTAVILAYAMIKEVMKSVDEGNHPISLKRGIEKAVKFSIKKISEYSHPVKSLSDIVDIASISAGNNTELGNIVACAIEQVGREGIIALEETQSLDTSLEISEGIRFNKGYMSPYFIKNTSNIEILQENPYILLTDKKISQVQTELVPILEQLAKTNRPLLIIAEDIEKEALSTLVLNNIQGIVDVVAVRAPGFGDRRKSFLDDLAVLTGGQVILEDIGMHLGQVSLDIMGSAKRVTVSRNYTTIIVDDSCGLVNMRCAYIKRQIAMSNNIYETEKLRERLLNLSRGTALIKLGASTELEMINKKLCLEDAINATQASIEDGIIPGGGKALVYVSQQLRLWAHQYLSDAEFIGALIVEKAMCKPLCKIVQNTGKNDSRLILEKLKKTPFFIGYDANICEITHMYNSGIVDAAKVTKYALRNAASIVSVVITTECVIFDSMSS